MATYKPIRKTASGTEEIKIPYAVIADPPTIPAAVTESTVSGWGFTKNTGTITGIKMNGSSKGTSGVVDLGTVITAHQDISGKQDKITSTAKLPVSLVSGLATVATSGSYNDLSNKPTILNEADVKGIKVNNAANADTAGKVANPLTILSSPSGGSIYETFLAYDGSAHKSFMFGTDFWVDQTGTPTVFLNNSGVTAGTYSNVTVDKKGRVTAGTNTPSLDGGTINKSKTIKMDASANSDGANLKWGTVNSKNPYIGYASDQVDGTFVVGSLLGTNYASGLAIGGGSGNLLWKGAKVATTSDIPNISGKVDKSAFSLEGTTLTITI